MKMYKSKYYYKTELVYNCLEILIFQILSIYRYELKTAIQLSTQFFSSLIQYRH